MENKTFAYESMGTHWKITIWDTITDTQLEHYRKAIWELSDAFDHTYSRFKRSSLIWKLAEQTGTIEVPTELVEMLAWYKQLYEPSNNKLNPLIGFTISDLGYDDTYSLIPKKEVRIVPDLGIVQIVDHSHIHLSDLVLIDLGALGKGYFVDIIYNYLRKQGLQHFLVDGSGDIRFIGPEPIRIGLEHPSDPTQIIGVAEMQGKAMCASAGNRRKWDKYTHIIDPTTNTSPQEIAASWVIADTAVLADALATCLFFVAPENFTSFNFEYCLLNHELKVKSSSGWPGELF
jgi:FAD:protein FMN transferase